MAISFRVKGFNDRIDGVSCLNDLWVIKVNRVNVDVCFNLKLGSEFLFNCVRDIMGFFK